MEKSINIGSGVETSISDLAEILIELFCLSGVKLKYAQSIAEDIKRSCVRLGKAERLLGYRPKTSLKEGLKSV